LVFFLIAFFSVTASVYHASHIEYALLPRIASTNDVMQWPSLVQANLSHHPQAHEICSAYPKYMASRITEIQPKHGVGCPTPLPPKRCGTTSATSMMHHFLQK
jgi:hypothetical protein